MDNTSYKEVLLIKYKKYILELIIIIILFILFILSILLDSYDTYITEGIYYDDYININVPIDDSDIIKIGNYILINDIKYEYRVKKYSEVLSNGITTYQTISLEIENIFIDKEVVTLKFYYNKERIINKIIEIII